MSLFDLTENQGGKAVNLNQTAQYDHSQKSQKGKHKTLGLASAIEKERKEKIKYLQLFSYIGFYNFNQAVGRAPPLPAA